MKKLNKYIPALTVLFFLISVLAFSQSNNRTDPQNAQAASMKPDSSVPVSSAVENPVFNDVRKKMVEMVRKEESPSFSVAVSQHGKVIWEESFGWADREKMIPATSQTMYSIASTSKPMTATGLMVLAERGQVMLSESANTYIAPAQLTAYDFNSSSATVKHLLNHTAGLPMHYTYFYEDEPYSKPDMAESIRRYGILVQSPGEYHEYSNFGYGILDFIIEKVSGRTFPEYMKKEVFLPLGMTHSSVNIDPDLEKYAAIRYEQDKTPIPFYDFDHAGASAVYCSAPDLLRFGMFHLKDHLSGQTPILEDGTIDEMHHEKDKDAVNWNEESNSGYTLGWQIGNYNGYRTVSHGGGMPGVTSSFILFPSEDIAIVVISNCLNFNTYGLANEIANILLPEKKNEEIKLVQKQSEPEPESSVSFSELVGTWEGTIKSYEGEIPVTMKFQDDGDVHVALNRNGTSNDLVHLDTLMSNVNYSGGKLIGQFYGTVETNDTKIYPHNIYVNIKLQGDRFVGCASAYSTTKRVHWMLPSYISLSKI